MLIKFFMYTRGRLEKHGEKNVDVGIMDFDVIGLLQSDEDVVLNVQHKLTGEIFSLCLNQTGGLCYLVQEPFGQSKKMIKGRAEEFVLTDESKAKVLQFAERMRLEKEEAKKNLAGLTIRTYERVSEAVEPKNIAAAAESEKSGLFEVLDRVVALTKNYRVYKDSGKLYFVCNCKTEADGFALKKWLNKKNGFDVWGEGTDIHFKKAYSEDEIWDAKWGHGLVVHN